MASLRDAHDTIAGAADQLSAAETARALRFIRQDDRERFILGRALARSMLAATFGIESEECALEPDANGKPRLTARPDIAISIAHSGDLVLVGVGADMQLGVDVERHRQDVEFESVGRLMFTPFENDAVLREPPRERMRLFFRQWVLKEALVKALGTGLMLDPRRFSIDQSACPPRVTFGGGGADDVGQGWLMEDVPVPDGYAAAVAWRRLDTSGQPGRRA